MSYEKSPNQYHKDVPGNPSTATSSKIKLRESLEGEPLRVLSEEDWKFWKHNGYVVVKGAITRNEAEGTASFLWEFEEKDPEDPTTWYTQPRVEMEMKELIGTEW